MNTQSVFRRTASTFAAAAPARGPLAGPARPAGAALAPPGRALALAAALTFVAPPVASLAQPEIPARGPMIASIDKPPAESESALGGFAAIGCGFFFRGTIAAG